MSGEELGVVVTAVSVEWLASRRVKGKRTSSRILVAHKKN